MNGAMNVIVRFQCAVTHQADNDEAGAARLPIRLSKACVQLLPITREGLPLFSAATGQDLFVSTSMVSWGSCIGAPLAW